MSRRRYWAWGALILLSALAVRIAVHVGVRTFEPVFTAHSAHELLRGTYEPQKYVPGSVNNARFGMVLPTALSARLWGFGDVASTAWPMVCGLLLVAGVLLLGPAGVGEKGALYAAALLALAPADVLYSSQLYSDLPMSLCWMVSAFLFWRALDSKSAGTALGAGLLVGLAWMIREPGPLLLLVLLFWAWREGAWRPWFWACGGAAAVFGLECFYYAYSTGDPFFRVGIMTSGVHARYMTEEYYPTTGAVLRRVFLELPSMMGNPLDPSFFYYAALPPAATVLFAALGKEGRSEPPARRLAGWFVLIFVLFAAMPVKLWPYRPSMVLLPRTLIPFSVPLALFIGWALARRSWGVPALGGALLLSLLSLFVVAPRQLEAKREIRGALEVLRLEKADLILADEVLSATGHRANVLAFDRQFDPGLYVYSLKDADPDAPEAKGAHVVINSAALADQPGAYPPDRMRRVLGPPPTWKRLYYREFKRRGDSRTYFVAVYRLPG